ncbi:MAG: sigma-70 family RNA polymerase sigma factor [Planctomycetota bacterium]
MTTPRPIPIQDLLEHADFVRGLARRLIHDPELAWDVEQETWVAAMQNPPRDRATARGWLGAVLRNFVRRAARDRGRREQRERHASRPDRLSPTDLLLERELALRSVVEAVLDLEERYREVVLYRFYEDLYPRQIAERLQVPVATVKSRLHRALEQLRGKLEQRCGKQWAVTIAAASGLGKNLTLAKAAAPRGLTALKMTGALSTKLVLPAAAVLMLIAGWLLFKEDGWLSSSTKDPSDPGVVEVASQESSRMTLTDEAEPKETQDNRPSSRSLPASESGDGATGGPSRREDPETEAGPSFRIRGTVVSTTGEPIAGATVQLEPPGQNISEVTADDHGEFSFKGSQLQGSIPLVAYHDDYHGLEIETLGRPVTRTIELAPGEVRDGVELVLVPGGRLSGSIVDASTGAPITDAVARLSWTATGDQSIGRTDPDGAFTIRGALTDRDLRLTASAPGYVTADYDESGERVFRFRPGETQGGVRIALKAAGRIEVLVLDGEGSPVPECGIWILPAEATPMGVQAQVDAGDYETPRYRTDSTGRVTLEGLQPNPMRVGARHSNFPMALSDELVVEPGRTHELTLELSIGARIYGVVQKEGRPLAGAWVESLGALHHAQTKADEHGNYVLDGFGPGTYVLAAGDAEIRRQEAIPATKRVTIEEGMTELEVNFGDEIVTGTRVHGRVLRGTRALGNVGVQFLGRDVSDPRFMRATQADAAGFYEFDALPPGSGLFLVLSDQNPVGGFGSNPVVVPESGELEKDLHVPTNRVTGHIDLGNLLPEDGLAWVSFNRRRTGDRSSLVDHLLDHRSGDSTRIAADGSFEIESLSPGTYVPIVSGAFRQQDLPESAQGNDFRSTRYPAFEIGLHSQIDLGVLELGEEPELLSIELRGPEGTRPSFSARVFSEGFESPNTALGRQGWMQLPLSPGRYDLEIHPEGFAPIRVAGIEQAEGKWSQLELDVEVGGTLEVVVTASGAPLSGVRIDVRDEAGRFPLVSSNDIERLFVSGGFRTNQAGQLRWDHLPAGEYRIRVGDREQSCSIRNGETSTLRFE